MSFFNFLKIFILNSKYLENVSNLSQTGDDCLNDFDGDGVADDEDVCPENKLIFKTDFNNLQTMDLCEKDNVKSNEFVYNHNCSSLFNQKRVISILAQKLNQYGSMGILEKKSIKD